ncbi:MAG: sugar transporter [Roseateles depolymerans]|uniref:TRAP transporter small permease protein n=1 Tax=Roseateles depolymerans TaxID=76731 RepID=A0A2W5DD18_9BURK|nr:MAG: sugar transporter [Roseateles depolymerans]
MNALLALSHAVDRLSDRLATLSAWATLLSCLVSALNALIRYGLDYSSNAFLEIQWYLFAACVMLGAAQVLRLNEHVRVDLVYGRLRPRAKLWLDLVGLLVLLVPVMAYLGWLSWGFFLVKLTSGMQASDSPSTLGWAPYLLKLVSSGEMSNNAGGLIRWPAALLLPLGFAMVALQGMAEAIKRVAGLMGSASQTPGYERPLQ